MSRLNKQGGRYPDIKGICSGNLTPFHMGQESVVSVYAI